MKHLFIVNPVAGGKKNKYEETVAGINQIMSEVGGEYEVYITQGPLDACRKIEADAETGEKIRVYACGGDGTFNECINAAACRKNVAVTSYPCGTGNDFIKTFEDEADLFKNLKALVLGDERPIDVIRCNDRYSVNICSVGIDARIAADVHKYSRIPLIGGATGYVVSLVVNVVKGIGKKMKIKTENKVRDGRFTLACGCNGRYYGGGFNPVPEAMLDDGIIDFLVIKEVSRLRFFNLVFKYAAGRYKEIPEYAEYIPAKYMEIEAEEDIVVNLDGESLIAKNITFEVVDGGINFFYPNKMRFFDTEKRKTAVK